MSRITCSIENSAAITGSAGGLLPPAVCVYPAVVHSMVLTWLWANETNNCTLSGDTSHYQIRPTTDRGVAVVLPQQTFALPPPSIVSLICLSKQMAERHGWQLRHLAVDWIGTTTERRLMHFGGLLGRCVFRSAVQSVTDMECHMCTYVSTCKYDVTHVYWSAYGVSRMTSANL